MDATIETNCLCHDFNNLGAEQLFIHIHLCGAQKIFGTKTKYTCACLNGFVVYALKANKLVNVLNFSSLSHSLDFLASPEKFIHAMVFLFFSFLFSSWINKSCLIRICYINFVHNEIYLSLERNVPGNMIRIRGDC